MTGLSEMLRLSREDCGQLRAKIDRLQAIVDQVVVADAQFGQFAAMRKHFTTTDASPTALLADLATIVHRAAEAARKET